MQIQLENIFKLYSNVDTTIQRSVFSNLSLTINSNDSIAIIGPSGSGKTSLLNIIGTLDKPTNGLCKVNGEDIYSFDEVKLCQYRNKHIGFVFQLHYLLPQLNVLENILLPVLADKSNDYKKALVDAYSFLEILGLKDRAKDFPTQLSVGECQRIAIIRALINSPSLVLADEPTGSLDHENAIQLIQLLLKLKDERRFALVLVTHSIAIANMLDKQYVMSKGKLIMQ